MKQFHVPSFYKSDFISKIKSEQKKNDPKKKDFSPFILDFDKLQFIFPRHFGFCFGVENAIEIAYDTLEKHKNKNIYLISEIIHNPEVNDDLLSKGVKFILDTYGNQIIPWEEVKKNDIVIIPAFGTSLENEKKMKQIGVQYEKFNATCPFVEKVWNVGARFSKKGFTIIIHGKYGHEETTATFSHISQETKVLVIRDINEAQKVIDAIFNKIDEKEFYKIFHGKYSTGFDISKHLQRIALVNQTTMLADETKKIMDLFSKAMEKKYGKENISNYFANTRDTLCYATNDNQKAILETMNYNADFALVIGGYNSSNTTNIAQICKKYMPTYFIKSDKNILSGDEIIYYDPILKKEFSKKNYMKKGKNKIVITSGASCPESVIERVIKKLSSLV